MARMIKLNNNGSKFLAKIIDCQADTPFDLASVIDQFIVFYKPDGTSFEKQGILVEDTENPGTFFIQYINDLPEESILDLRDTWEYTGKVQLQPNDDFAEASTRIVFWVV